MRAFCKLNFKSHTHSLELSKPFFVHTGMLEVFQSNHDCFIKANESKVIRSKKSSVQLSSYILNLVHQHLT